MLFKLCVIIPEVQAKRLRKLRLVHGLSASSLVEVALAAYLYQQSAVARRAASAGATLRRVKKTV